MSIDQPQDNPIRQPDPAAFAKPLQAVAKLFACYINSSTAPLVSSGLMVTPEIRYQSEFYLPIRKIRNCFYALFRQALYHRPVYSSTPFHSALSWADLYCSLPPWAQLSPNPALFIDQLLTDRCLLEKFIYLSFLPERFNGSGFCRYQDQYQHIFKLLKGWKTGRQIKVLDAACGSGEGSWELLSLADNAGVTPDRLELQGWTLEPLEVFAARNQYLPHLPERGSEYRKFVTPLLEKGWGLSAGFSAVDLLDLDTEQTGISVDLKFDLIVCNGLIGGPIINQPQQVAKVIHSLARQLAADGVLLMDNCFHGGWKKRFTSDNLKKQLELAGLETGQIKHGISATRVK